MLDNGFEPKKNNLTPDPSRFPTISMNFNQTMKCDNRMCPYHDKDRHCSSPSIVKIGVGGQCVPYHDWFIKSMRKEKC